ncbi:MAG: NADH-quinone oxidoreductase subunit N [Nocardioidaceae bacterium]
MIQEIDWWAIAAPLLLVGGGLLALMADAFAPRLGRSLGTGLGLLALVAAMGVTWRLNDETRVAFCLGSGDADAGSSAGCSWVVDDVTVIWWAVILGATAMVVLLLHSLVGDGLLPPGELSFLLMSSAAGALSLAAAGDLVTLVVAMETVSLPAFALVALRRGHRVGAEAALTFFLASVVATAVTLLGISMVYGATGSVAAVTVNASVAAGVAVEPVLGVGVVLTLVGLAFKVAAVPFQVWVPDTYVGAPVPIAAYLSVVSKAAGLAGLVIVLVRFFPTYVDSWSVVVAVAAALTMTVGNLAALRQQHAVRLLAWSSVAQAGYLLVPLAAGGSPTDIGALQAYAAMYAVVNLGAFAVVHGAARWGATTVADFSGLGRRSPWLAVALAFALLCLAGLPPGVVGLVAKVVIFESAIDGDLLWLAVVMAVNVAIGLVYYLRFLAVLWRQVDPDTPREVDLPGSTDVVVGLTLTAAVVTSMAPSLLFGPVLG